MTPDLWQVGRVTLLYHIFWGLVQWQDVLSISALCGLLSAMMVQWDGINPCPCLAPSVSLLVPILQTTIIVTWALLQLDTCDCRAPEHSGSKISPESLLSTSVWVGHISHILEPPCVAGKMGQYVACAIKPGDVSSISKLQIVEEQTPEGCPMISILLLFLVAPCSLFLNK